MINRWYIRSGDMAQVIEVDRDSNFEDAAVIALSLALNEIDSRRLGPLTVGSRVSYDFSEDPDCLCAYTNVLLGRLSRLASADLHEG